MPLSTQRIARYYSQALQTTEPDSRAVQMARHMLIESLSQSEFEVLARLSRQGSATAKEMANHTGLSLGATHKVLNNLRSFGLLRSTAPCGPPATWTSRLSFSTVVGGT